MGKFQTEFDQKPAPKWLKWIAPWLYLGTGILLFIGVIASTRPLLESAKIWYHQQTANIGNVSGIFVIAGLVIVSAVIMIIQPFKKPKG